MVDMLIRLCQTVTPHCRSSQDQALTVSRRRPVWGGIHRLEKFGVEIWTTFNTSFALRFGDVA